MDKSSTNVFFHANETSEIEPLGDPVCIGFSVNGGRAQLSIWMTQQVAWAVVAMLQRQLAEAALRPEPVPAEAPLPEMEF